MENSYQCVVALPYLLGGAELTRAAAHSLYAALDELLEAPEGHWIHKVRYSDTCTSLRRRR